MNDKIKSNIWRVAEENELGDIVIGYGVDRIWELMQEQVEWDIFTPLEQICKDILIDLAACDAK